MIKAIAEYPYISARERDGLMRLASIILTRFPDAQFDVERAIDDPEAVHLLVSGDFDDIDDVFDLTEDEQEKMLVDEDLPLFVIPLQRDKQSANVTP